MEKFLMEGLTIKAANVPVDMNAAAITGARISLAKGFRVAIVCHMGASVGATVQFTLKQHNAAVAGTSKVLSVANVYYKKVGAATSFTKVEPTVAASLYDLSADFAANEGVVVFEVLAEDLDVQNDFTHLSVDVADSAAAKILSAQYVMHACKEIPAYAIAL